MMLRSTPACYTLGYNTRRACRFCLHGVSSVFYTSYSIILFFFFFQAEDGIRDYKVTGVQTCALPICPSRARTSPELAQAKVCLPQFLRVGLPIFAPLASYFRYSESFFRSSGIGEIGRASCRERV